MVRSRQPGGSSRVAGSRLWPARSWIGRKIPVLAPLRPQVSGVTDLSPSHLQQRADERRAPRHWRCNDVSARLPKFWSRRPAGTHNLRRARRRVVGEAPHFILPASLSSTIAAMSSSPVAVMRPGTAVEGGEQGDADRAPSAGGHNCRGEA